MGRRQIPAVLYEAARAGRGQPGRSMFWRVTLPQLRYTIVTSSTLIIVGSLTYFDIVYIMTDGGPGYTTRVLSLDMYQVAFQQNEYGYASVLAVSPGRGRRRGFALGLVRFSGFGSMSSQQEGADRHRDPVLSAPPPGRPTAPLPSTAAPPGKPGRVVAFVLATAVAGDRHRADVLHGAGQLPEPGHLPDRQPVAALGRPLG